MRLAVVVVVLGAGGLGACSARDQEARPRRGGEEPATTTVVAPAVPATTALPQTATVPTTAVPATSHQVATPVVVAYRVERRVTDRDTENFEAVVEATLSDPRGWERAGFELVRMPDAPFLIVLASGEEVDELCRPYEVWSTYSCQNGAVVALNADRWRQATPKWTGDLATYQEMLVNHEVGHLLGQHHPRVQCPARGRAAAVMAQQSTELDGCLPNAWPLDWEIALAARHDEPLAPPHPSRK